MTIRQFLLACFCCVTPCLTAQTSKIKLSEMNLSSIYQPYGTPLPGKAVTGEPLRVAGTFFTDGIGVQANSKIKISLQGKSSLFTCKIGINDQSVNYKDSHLVKIPLTDGTMLFYDQTNGRKQYVGTGKGNGEVEKGSVVFKITGDGKELYNSGIMRGGETARAISLPVEGIKILELEAESANDGLSGDHADWLEAVITYFEIRPSLVAPEYQGEIASMSKEVERSLQQKIGQLETVCLPLPSPSYDWLICNQEAKAKVYQANQGKDIVLSNGLVSRVFRIFPNLATVDIQNLMTGENMLRAVSNEGILTLDGKNYSLGGLDGQPEFGYTQYKWLDRMEPFANSFRVIDFRISEITPRINWKSRRWALEKKRNPSGKQQILGYGSFSCINVSKNS